MCAVLCFALLCFGGGASGMMKSRTETLDEGTKERKTIRRPVCASTNMPLPASRSHCDSYGRVGCWLGERWKH